MRRRQASSSTTDAVPSGSAGSGRKPERSTAPADVFLAADACAFASLGGEDVRVAGVLVAPAQVGVQGAGPDGVVGVDEGELPQGPEVGLDRIGPGRVGRGEAELDLVPVGPAADPPVPVRGQVVEDDVDRSAVREGRADGPQCRPGVVDTLAAADDSPGPVVADRVAAVEAVAASMTKSSSSMLSRRGRPPAHRGSRQAGPTSSNRWITSRTVSSSAWTSCAISRPAARRHSPRWAILS